MKTRDEVIPLFRDKYEDLKAVCQQQIEPFNESAIYQNPDGGWQLNLEQPGTDYKAAITLRPNDEVPHETHGVIGARWFQEGGAFDVNGIPGWLGYPIKDETEQHVWVQPPMFSYPPTCVQPDPVLTLGRVSEFEFGTIEFVPDLPGQICATKPYVQIPDGIAVPSHYAVSLNEQGKRHVPKDIENAIEVLLRIQGVHVEGDRSWSCDLHHSLPVGLEWKFHAKVKEYEEFSIVIERAGTDIHATINARGKSSFLGGAKAIEKQFTIPNRFRAI